MAKVTVSHGKVVSVISHGTLFTAKSTSEDLQNLVSLQKAQVNNTVKLPSGAFHNLAQHVFL